MKWWRRGCELFRGNAARTLRDRWTRDPTRNIQIPAVCSLWHRITQHQTWPTHLYWFCLSSLWQQQDSPCRILSLVSTYFIIIYLVCTLLCSVHTYLATLMEIHDFRRDNEQEVLNSFGFGLTQIIPQLLLSPKTVRKATQYSCSHLFSDHKLILHHYTKTQITLQRNDKQTAHRYCLLIPTSYPPDSVSCT
jgi:hypothetical protein